MNNINLRQLEILVAIVECGSFTEAAGQLYLAQSTVSSHIRSLEENLHTQLFKRETKKKIALTDAGKRVYQFAREIVLKCNQLVSELERELHQEIVIGASTAPSQDLVPRLTAKFLSRHPECVCTVKFGNSDEIQRMLIEQSIQLGFIGTCDNRQALMYECVAEDHLVLVTANNDHYARLQRDGLCGKHMLDEPFIFRESSSATQRYAENYMSTVANTANLTIKAYVSNSSTLLGLVERGTGVSVISYLSAKEKIDNGELLAFELDDPPLRRNIYLARLRKGYANELVREFVSLAREPL